MTSDVETSGEDGRARGDDPITAPAEDLLARTAFAGRLAEAIRAVKNEQSSCVFALVGPWGSGKTSVLNLARRELPTGERDWTVVEFSPWMVSDLESLVVEFFTALGSALGGDETLTRRLGDLAGQLIPASKLLKFVGVDLTGALEAMREGLAPAKSLATRHSELSTALIDRPGPVLIVVDDLDRLHASELTLVFKLIRLVGRLPKVHYLVAFDGDTVIDVLKTTEIAGSDESRARDYLEKIVQYRFDLPPIHQSQAWQMFTARLEDVVHRWSVALDDDGIDRLVGCWHDFMSTRLITPRAINRFVEHVESVWPLLKGEADFTDVAILTFLRTLEPGVYQLVSRSKEKLTLQLAVPGRRDEKPDQLKDDWNAALERSGLAAERTEPMLNLLARLFPALGTRLRTGTGGRRVGDDELSKARRVGSAEYFDRYFHLGVVPGVDVPDSTVRKAIAEYVESRTEAAFDDLLAALDTESTRAIWKFVRAWDEMTLDDWAPVVAMAAELYVATPRSSGLLGSDVIVLTSSVARLVSTQPVSDLESTLERCAELDPDLRFITDLAFHLRTLAEDEDSASRPSAQAEEVARVVLKAVDYRLDLLARDRLNEDSDAMRFLRYRADLGRDPDRLHDWVWDRLRDDSCPWDLRTMLGLCVAIDESPGRAPALVSRYPGNVQIAIDTVLGVDRALEELGPLDGFEGALPQFDEDVSIESRTRHAMHVLANAQREQ